MRRAIALLLLAFALAGCTAGTSDDPNTPPNADPNGAQTLPPVQQDTATTGPPSNTTSASSSSTTTYEPRSFGPHDEEDTASDAGFPGLFVSGKLQNAGSQVGIQATANNMGERPFKVADGTCAQPWSETLHAPGGFAVQHREPAITCQAFALKAFPAHEFLSMAMAWNGTLWDETANAYVPAPSGTYVWEIVFDVYSGGTGAEYEDHAALRLSFDVNVP